MRIRSANIKKKRFLAWVFDPRLAIVRNRDRAARVAGNGFIKGIDRLGGNVIFAATGGSIAGLAEQHRQADNV